MTHQEPECNRENETTMSIEELNIIHQKQPKA